MSASRQVALERGQFLFLQGQPSDSFYILKSGQLEVLSNDEKTHPTEDEVRTEARRVAVLDQPNVPIGEIGVLEGTPRSASIRALERCELIWVAGGQRALLEWVRGNLSAGLLIARALASRSTERHRGWHRVVSLTRRLETYRDNFSILYSVFNTRLLRQDSGFGQIVQHGRNLVAQFDQKNPPSISNVDRNVPGLDTVPAPDQPFREVEFAYFLDALLAQPDAALGWMLQPGPSHPLLYATQRLTEILPRISNDLHASMRAMERTLEAFFGAEGLVQAYLQLSGALLVEQRDAIKPYIHKLLDVTHETQGHVHQYWGETYPEIRSLDAEIDQLERMLRELESPAPTDTQGAGMGASPASASALPAPEPRPVIPQAPAPAGSGAPAPSEARRTPAPTPSGAPAPGAPAPLAGAGASGSAAPGGAPAAATPARAAASWNLTGPTLDLRAAAATLNLTSAEKTDLETCLGLKEGEPHHVYAAFWRLYPRLWRANLSANLPEVIAFLRYGIASPTPIQVSEKLNLATKPTGPILYADQWLMRVYRGESLPSRNDLGQTYDEVLKETRATRYAPDEPEQMMDPVRFEIDQMMMKAARAFSAGRGEQATIRRTFEEAAELAEQINSTNKIAEALVRLIRLDFTLFYRDVRVTLEERSEFLPKEVLPFLIVVPASGDRALCWQEFEGRSKDTPGRLVYPLLCPGVDLFDLTIAVCAKFRWDLAKTIAGADWMNPADGGLTGRYFDYVEYYEKNTELSDDAKERIKEQFANARFDADKFALEYALYVKFESQAIQKLNRVSRRIFIEYCPFTLEVRKRLARQPAFSEFIRKDSNKRLKRRQELERRIYKLERNGIAIGNAFDAALKIFQDVPE